MTQPQPAISVCIPVYNGGAFISAALQSVLQQDFQDIEILILDNASTDDTLARVAEFSDARIRIYKQKKNVGAVPNFNTAIREAVGVWIKILCADDVLYPTCLQRQYASVTSGGENNLVMACCGRTIIDDEGRPWLTRTFSKRSGVWDGGAAMRRSIRAGTNLFGEPPAALLHRETALLAGGFSPDWSFCTDLDFWARILQHGGVYVESEALCAFRVSAQSWSIVLARTQAHEFANWLRYCRSEKLVGLTPVDRVLGLLNAYVLMVLRWCFYRLLAWKRRG